MAKKSDPNLKTIVENLCGNWKCHTVILYGSRARGEETSTSDYDVLGVRKSGRITRDARFWNETYLDIFIYPESKIRNPTDKLVYMRDGIVLCEKARLGTRFLNRLNEIYKTGPKKLAADQVQAHDVWVEKCLKRIQKGDVEGNFRRMQVIPEILEHYFLVRGRWYEGPRKSLAWLAQNEPEIFSALDAAMKPISSIEALERLVEITS